MLSNLLPFQNKNINLVHNSTAGHNGVEKTLNKLEARGEETWPHMREHVKQFIRDCPICQKLDQRNVKIQTVPFTNATLEPMDTLNIDTIGPVPLDQFGNCYILVIIDCFTRFVELYAIPDTSEVRSTLHTTTYWTLRYSNEDPDRPRLTVRE